MSKGANHNSGAAEAPVSAAGITRLCRPDAPATIRRHVRHIYVHIPFCARICPYCAFYKDLLDRSQTSRFCEALLRELELNESRRRTGDRRSLLRPSTIYFGGGTPTALNIAQLELLLRGFHERLELSQLVEWTIEANPGSVSARKAALLKKFGVNRISLGVQSWDDELLKLLGREHNAQQAEESFRILRDAGFTNVNVDLMFGLPGQTVDQWRATLEKTIALATGAYFHLLPDVRRRHGIFPAPRSRRISAGCGCRRRILRNDNGDPGRCRLPSITKSRITRVLVSNQFIIAPTGSAKIIWESDRARSRPLGCSAGKMSAIIALTLIALLPANQHARIERKSDGSNETHRADRAFAAHARRNFRFES